MAEGAAALMKEDSTRPRFGATLTRCVPIFRQTVPSLASPLHKSNASRRPGAAEFQSLKDHLSAVSPSQPPQLPAWPLWVNTAK